MFITLGNSTTSFRTSDNSWGANPAKTLEDHLRNMAEFLNGYTSNTVEIRLDTVKKTARVVEQ